MPVLSLRSSCLKHCVLGRVALAPLLRLLLLLQADWL